MDNPAFAMLGCILGTPLIAVFYCASWSLCRFLLKGPRK